MVNIAKTLFVNFTVKNSSDFAKVQITSVESILMVTLIVRYLKCIFMSVFPSFGMNPIITSLNTPRPRQNGRHCADGIFNAFSGMKMY